MIKVALISKVGHFLVFLVDDVIYELCMNLYNALIVANTIRNFTGRELLYKRQTRASLKVMEEKMSILTLHSIIHQVTSRLTIDTEIACDTAPDPKDDLMNLRNL